MAVISVVKTNATREEILDAISSYNADVYFEEGKDMHRVYMAPYDRYHLSCEDANDTLESNLKYEFDKQKKKLQFKVIKTELE